MMGIKYFRFKNYTLGSYGWHTLHTGLGFMTGCGYDVSAKYFTIGKYKLLLAIKEKRKNG